MERITHYHLVPEEQICEATQKWITIIIKEIGMFPQQIQNFMGKTKN